MKTLKVFLCTEVEYYSDYQKLCLYVDAIYLFQNSTLLSSHGTITYLQLVVVFLSELVPDRCLRFWVDGSGEVVGALDARSERRHRLLAARRECRRGVTSSSWQHQTGLSGRPGGSILLIKYVGQLRSRCAGVTRAARAESVVCACARRWICEWSAVVDVALRVLLRVPEWRTTLLLVMTGYCFLEGSGGYSRILGLSIVEHPFSSFG